MYAWPPPTLDFDPWLHCPGPSTYWLIALLLHARYKILAPAETDRILAKDAENMKGVADAILDSVKLNPESFRLGHTKACTLGRAHFCRKQLTYITTLTLFLFTRFIKKNFKRTKAIFLLIMVDYIIITNSKTYNTILCLILVYKRTYNVF